MEHLELPRKLVLSTRASLPVSKHDLHLCHHPHGNVRPHAWWRLVSLRAWGWYGWNGGSHSVPSRGAWMGNSLHRCRRNARSGPRVGQPIVRSIRQATNGTQSLRMVASWHFAQEYVFRRGIPGRDVGDSIG